LTAQEFPAYKGFVNKESIQQGSFFVADLNAKGELHQLTEYDYATLEMIPDSTDLISRCAAAIAKNSHETQADLRDSGDPTIRWRATAPGTGIATVRRAGGEIVSLSLLAAGLAPESEKVTFETFQQHLARELRETPYEPAFDLLQLDRRPLLASFTFAGKSTSDSQMIEALADRAFAAAYFRSLGLA
jgi:hypothetical protein